MTTSISSSNQKSFEKLSDKGVCEIYRGNYSEAIRLLLLAESLSKEEYIVAANLGTAYELDGNLPLAVKWIGIGIDRNPKAHAGTEWLHIEILKAKQALLASPDWLATHHVLGSRSPRARHDYGTWAQHLAADSETMLALTYQLKERLQFVNPPDPVVADLLVDYGILSARDRTLGDAKFLFDLAIKFGAPTAEVHRHLNYAQHRVDAHEAAQAREKWIRIAAALLLAVAGLIGIIWLIRRRWSRR